MVAIPPVIVTEESSIEDSDEDLNEEDCKSKTGIEALSLFMKKDGNDIMIERKKHKMGGLS